MQPILMQANTSHQDPIVNPTGEMDPRRDRCFSGFESEKPYEKP